MIGGDERAHPIALGWRRRDREASALGEVGRDRLFGADPPDLIDRIEHHPAHRERARAAVLGRYLLVGGREQAETPASVASGGAEAGDVPFDHRYPEGRIGLRQVVGGPEAGEARAYDRDVNGSIAGQRGSRGEVARGLQPEAVCAVKVPVPHAARL